MPGTGAVKRMRDRLEGSSLNRVHRHGLSRKTARFQSLSVFKVGFSGSH
jgi:hypothetical protein